jgi:hypothetical protein
MDKKIVIKIPNCYIINDITEAEQQIKALGGVITNTTYNYDHSTIFEIEIEDPKNFEETLENLFQFTNITNNYEK